MSEGSRAKRMVIEGAVIVGSILLAFGIGRPSASGPGFLKAESMR